MGSTPIGISGSRAAAILGLSQYSTPFTVWQELMEKRKPGFNAERGYIFEKFEGNAATEFGKAFESAIIDLTEQATGDSIFDRERSYSLPDREYVTCHIDGQFKRSGKMYEGKSCNHRAFYSSWGEPGTDRIPQSYQVQNQHSMLCNGLSETTLGVLVFPKTVDEWAEMGWNAVSDPQDNSYTICGPNGAGDFRHPIEWAEVFRDIGNFHTYHIEAKPDTQKILKELYEEFWFKYVIPGVAPDCVDYSDVRRIFTAPKGVLVVDEKQAELMREFKDVGREIGKAGFLSKRRDFLKVQILKHVMVNTTVADEDAVEKVVIMDQSGNKLGSYNGKSYRS